ncbi:MAG: calcium-binding protein [Cyanobacteria bacterium P01_F01_bin.86]
MPKTYHGTDGNDVKAAHKTWGFWRRWDMFGHEGNDVLTGGPKDDLLDGGEGVDRLVGGNGSDTYKVDSSQDTVIENANQGLDHVYSTASYFRLGQNVENLTLEGGSNIHGYGNDLSNTLRGNSGNNTLRGYGGNDTLYGNAGNDRLDGGTGADYMEGGAQDDTYVIDNVNDYIFDSSGYDTVESQLNEYTLGSGLEALKLSYHNTSVTNGYGNALDNTLTGNARDNAMNGGNGDDILYGRSGDDTLLGGHGDDILVGVQYSSISEVDDLYGNGGSDTFQLYYYAGYGYAQTYHQDGHAVIHDFSQAEGDTIAVLGSEGDYRLGQSENLVGDSALDTAIIQNSTNNVVGIVEDNLNVSLADLSYTY